MPNWEYTREVNAFIILKNTEHILSPLEKKKVTHSSILAWRIRGLYSPCGRKESDTPEWLSLTILSPVIRQYTSEQKIYSDKTLKRNTKSDANQLTTNEVWATCALGNQEWDSPYNSVDREYPLEKGVATHSRILPAEFYGQKSLSSYSPEEVAKSRIQLSD